MFNNHQIIKISEAISGTWLLINNQSLPESALDIFLEDIEHYPFDVVMLAIKNARKKAKSKLTLNDITNCILEQDGRPSVDEAWAIACMALDDNAVFFWTDETAIAWGVASPLVEIGDKFNANKVFKEKYESLTTENRQQLKRVNWFMTSGDNPDPVLRERAIFEAIESAKIQREHGFKLLPSASKQHAETQVYKSLQAKTLLIEDVNKPVKLDSIDQLNNAAALHKARIDAMNKAIGLKTTDRPDGTKSKRDSLEIFEDAEKLGLFSDAKERAIWLEKASIGQNLKELQIRILNKRGAKCEN